MGLFHGSHSHQHGAHEHHEHDHDHAHGSGGVEKSLRSALWITVVFFGVELAAGWYANSLALISDGAHMLTDVGALLLSLFTHWVARRPATARMSFGYHRAEILGALASGLAIWLIAGGLIWEAFQRLSSPPEVKGGIVLGVAVVGLIANLLSMRSLHGVQSESLNARSAYLHLFADAMGSIGAVIAGAVLWLTGWRLIDPLITVFFSVLMLWGSWGLVRESVDVLMERTPAHLDPEQIRKELLALPGVESVHDLHIWSVSSGRPALSVHLRVKTPAGVLAAANDWLRKHHGVAHTTIQVEHAGEFDAENCADCERESV